MKLRTLFIIASAYLTVVGFGFTLFPQAFGTGAIPVDASPVLITYLRIFGAPLLGIAILDWLARNEKPSKARDAIILGNLVGFAVIALQDVWGVFHDARPATKVFVFIHLFFAIAFIVAYKNNRFTAAG